MTGHGPAADDTQELAALRSSDWSWHALLVSAGVAVAFVAGTYLGASERAPAPSSAYGAWAPPNLYASAQGAGTATSIPADGYMLAATLDSSPRHPPPLALPASAPKFYLHYSLPGWPPDARVHLSWKLAGASLPTDRVRWRPRRDAKWASGYFVLSPPSDSGRFAPGIYEVELTGPGHRREFASFAVVSGLEAMLRQQPPQQALLVTKPVIALGVDAQARPLQPTSSVPASASTIYACFSFDAAVPGTVLQVRWFHAGREVTGSRSRIKLPSPSGNAYGFVQRSQQAFATGRWTAAIFIEGGRQPLAQASFAVVAANP